MYGNLLSTVTKITRDRGDLIRIVIMSWNEDLLDVDHRTHDIRIVSPKTWSRRSLFYGRAQTCRSQSNVWNSRKLLHVTLNFETKILRSDWFAQENLISVAQTLQNWRIGLRRRPNGKSDVPAKQRGSWPKSVLKKEKHKTPFFSPSENLCLPAPSILKTEEWEFVVDSGASMHMISKQDLNSAEMDTLTKSCSPTIVITAGGEVQDAWRGHSVCQRIGYILDNESPRRNASSIVARKALRWTWILTWADQRLKTTSH